MQTYTGCAEGACVTPPSQTIDLEGLAVRLAVFFNDDKRIVVAWDAHDGVDVELFAVYFSYGWCGPKTCTLSQWVETRSDPFGSSGSLASLPFRDAGPKSWYRVAVEVEALGGEAPRIKALERQTRETAALSLMRHQTPHDVCLDFPQVGKQLWTTEAFLVASSPYFKDLLSSDFAEGHSSISEVSGAPGEDASYPFNDSDAETDAAEVVERSKQAVHTPLAPFKRVVVTESCYTTYSAVLLWLQTGHISFAPLRSASRLEQGRASAATEGPLSSTRLQAGSHGPTLLPLASPKSVYRLADYLSLDALRSVALANLVSQLTPANAAHELFSDVSSAYADMRDAVLDYVVEHWSEVRGAAGTQEVQERALRGELPPAAAGTSLRLARRVGEELGA